MQTQQRRRRPRLTERFSISRETIANLWINIIAGLIVAGIIYLIGAASGWLPALLIPRQFAIPLIVPIVVALVLALIVLIAIRRRKGKADLERLGFNQYISVDPLLVDNTHRFLLIQQTFYLDGYDGRFVLRYRGANVSNHASEVFTDCVAGDSAADIEHMAIRVLDRTSGLPLKWELLKDDPYEKVIEIHFSQPLDPGDSFDIEFSCQWLGTFTRKKDYVFYPMHHYRRGVRKLIAELILNARPSYIRGLRVDGEKQTLQSKQPTIDDQAGKCVVRWEIDHPRNVYIIQYEREDI